MIRYSCPVCGEQMESEDAIAGKIDVCGACEANVRAAWREMLDRLPTTTPTTTTSGSIASVAAPLRLCPSQPISTPDDLMSVMYWLQDAFDYLAMGNYPYSSSYILNGDGFLPPYPFQVACSGAIGDPDLAGGDALLSALSVGLYRSNQVDP